MQIVCFCQNFNYVIKVIMKIIEQLSGVIHKRQVHIKCNICSKILLWSTDSNWHIFRAQNIRLWITSPPVLLQLRCFLEPMEEEWGSEWDWWKQRDQHFSSSLLLRTPFPPFLPSPTSSISGHLVLMRGIKRINLPTLPFHSLSLFPRLLHFLLYPGCLCT